MSKVLDKKLTILLVILVAAVLLTASTMYLVFMRMSAVPPAPFKPDPTPNEFEQSLPVRLTVSDVWAGGAIATGSVTIYKHDSTESFDSGTTDSNGVWTTNKAMRTGDQYWVKISKTTGALTAYKYFDFIVPVATSTGQVYHYRSLDFYTIPPVVITMDMPNGTALADAGCYNVTEASNEYPTFNVQLRNSYTTSDSGFMSYWDPIKIGGVQREIVFWFQISGSQYEQLIVKNRDLIYQASSSRYYGFTLDPEKLIIDKRPDGTYNLDSLGEDLDGIYTFTIQFDASGLTDNADGPEIVFYIYGDDNMDYFQTYGTDLSDAQELQATDYNIEVDA